MEGHHWAGRCYVFRSSESKLTMVLLMAPGLLFMPGEGISQRGSAQGHTKPDSDEIIQVNDAAQLR